LHASQGTRKNGRRGKHLVGVEEFAAPRRLFSSGEWHDIKETFKTKLLEQWRHYAPNMTPDNVIAVNVIGPDNIENMHPDMVEGGYSEASTMASQLGRFRPIPELSGYRTILKNVYTCSSNLHSGSGIGRGSRMRKALVWDIETDEKTEQTGLIITPDDHLPLWLTISRSPNLSICLHRLSHTIDTQ
jgi:beta-carotene ketolase (CrtO type)